MLVISILRSLLDLVLGFISFLFAVIFLGYSYFDGLAYEPVYYGVGSILFYLLSADVEKKNNKALEKFMEEE